MDFKMKKFLPILLALFLFLPSPVYGQSVVDRSIAIGTDDADHHLSPAHVISAINPNIEASDRSVTNYDAESGLRFINITIPQGGTIVSAFLQVKANLPRGVGGWDTVFTGQASDDTITFAADIDWHTRDVRTTNTVVWNPPAWVVDTTYTSPDLVLIIQEIIDRPGWVSDNSLVIFWGDNLGVGFQADLRLRADSFELGTPARLIINWLPIPPLTPSSVVDGWISFIGSGLAILFVAFACGIFLWLVKAPPLMMLICGWLSLLLLFELGVVSAAVVLIALVGFVGAIFFKIVLGSGESA